LNQALRQSYDDARKRGADMPQDFEAAAQTMRTLLEIGHFQNWVVECGKNEGVYERDFPTVYLTGLTTTVEFPNRERFVPHALFRDAAGNECRLLDISDRMRDKRWRHQRVRLCKRQGEWINDALVTPRR
jgi:hypothetical protein